MDGIADAKTTLQSPVIVVDHYTGFSLTDLSDPYHPGDTGEENMAQKWFDGILDTLVPDPYFLSEQLVKTPALEGVEYVGSVEADAVIPQGGSLVFTKVAGPPWLEIAADGTLSGIGRHVNTGLNSFTVRATGDEGTYAEAELQITVLDTFSGELGLSDVVGLAYYWIESECVGEPL